MRTLHAGGVCRGLAVESAAEAWSAATNSSAAVSARLRVVLANSTLN
jgi:hypothetical protein